MADQTIICRCEDITREKLLQVIAEGCHTIDEIKRATRAGMGLCQGRNCRKLIAEELSRIYHIPVEEVLQPTFRAPVQAVSMGMLADAYKEGAGE
ncbi:MAG: (2Fe-2S)-binding protein [Clostridia bacterium]|nr:(2Fe-2S)-binding protein [Clostridia bacterium]